MRKWDCCVELHQKAELSSDQNINIISINGHCLLRVDVTIGQCKCEISTCQHCITIHIQSTFPQTIADEVCFVKFPDFLFIV